MRTTTGAPTPGNVERSSKLVREGIKEEWGEDGLDQTASDRKGYPNQAHHCISCSVIQQHSESKLAKLVVQAGYDVNNGKNCIFLPAKFGHMRRNNEQRHRGGHWDTYYKYVGKQLDPLYTEYKDKDPCKDEEARKEILEWLIDIERTIYNDLDQKKSWLYDWSELLYNEDYREEGPGPLTAENRQPSSSAGLEWVTQYPRGTTRRKCLKNGNLRTAWYSSHGFPVPGSTNS